MDKAREVHKNRLREMRAPLLEALDIEMNNAVLAELASGSGKATQTYDGLEARTQALRDVTIDPRIESAKTPDELKVIIPNALM